MGSWRAFAAASVVLALAAPAAARDRDGRRTIHEFERDGFLIGFSLGFGSSHPCDVCPGFGGSFMLGGMAQEDLAIVFDMAAVTSERDRRDQGLGLITIGARYWPHYRVWVQGGAGLGYPIDDFVLEEEGPGRKWGAMAGAGYEIVQRGRFAFDVQVRGGIAGDRKNVALTLGFNWY